MGQGTCHTTVPGNDSTGAEPTAALRGDLMDRGHGVDDQSAGHRDDAHRQGGELDAWPRRPPDVCVAPDAVDAGHEVDDGRRDRRVGDHEQVDGAHAGAAQRLEHGGGGEAGPPVTPEHDHVRSTPVPPDHPRG